MTITYQVALTEEQFDLIIGSLTKEQSELLPDTEDYDAYQSAINAMYR